MSEDSYPPIDARIDVDDYYDLRYWSNRLNVAKWRIKEAVLEVGDSAMAVSEYLRANGPRRRRDTHDMFVIDVTAR